jgi:diphthamide synthase (EF-2-diphthine--ammonia ligase)
MTIPKAFLSWSSGKDSAFALLEARRLGLAAIVGVLTTVNEFHDRVSMHGVRNALLDRQVAALNLPCLKVFLPSPCSNQVYEARMGAAVERIKARACVTWCSATCSSKTSALIAKNGLQPRA